ETSLRVVGPRTPPSSDKRGLVSLPGRPRGGRGTAPRPKQFAATPQNASGFTDLRPQDVPFGTLSIIAPLRAIGRRSRVEGDKGIEGAGIQSGPCRIGSFAPDGFGVETMRKPLSVG